MCIWGCRQRHLKHLSSQSTAGENCVCTLGHVLYIRAELGEVQGMVGELWKGVSCSSSQGRRRKESERFRGDTRA